MAEGLLRHIAGGCLRVASAGTHPSTSNPLAVEVMQEIDIDISDHRSKGLDDVVSFDWVITLCDQAAEKYALLGCRARTLHWNVADPFDARGSVEVRRAAYRECRRELERRIRELVESGAFA